MDNKEKNVPDIDFGTGSSEKLMLEKPPVSEKESTASGRSSSDSKPIEGFGSHSVPADGEGDTPAPKKPVRRPVKKAGAENGADVGVRKKKRVPKPAAAANTAAETENKPHTEEKTAEAPVKLEKPAHEPAREAESVSEALPETEPAPVIDEFDAPEEEFYPPETYEEAPPRRRSSAKRSAGKGKGKGKNTKKKKKRDRILNTSIITGLTITIVVISASLVLSTGAITLGMEYLGLNKSDKEVTFNIPQGANSDQIADLLIENNIIKNKKLFKLAMRMGGEPVLYPGDITLSPNKSYPGIIEMLAEQRELYETVTLTFSEGTNLRAVGAKLEKNGVCTQEDFLFQFNNKLDLPLDSKITHSSDVYYSMEGYFFPDTYEFYTDDSAYNVSKIVRENFDSKITPEMYARMDEIGMDLNEVITLASIVQWESGSVEDMPIVASVFLNRLKDKDTFPNLQSDATANYVTKVIEKVETSSAMLDHYKNVYDTYVCFGLPAGPVCNPGLDAINAVLYPEDTNYYYFCNNLKTGESFFAETYKEHQKNLKKAGLKE